MLSSPAPTEHRYQRGHGVLACFYWRTRASLRSIESNGQELRRIQIDAVQIPRCRHVAISASCACISLIAVLCGIRRPHSHQIPGTDFIKRAGCQAPRSSQFFVNQIFLNCFFDTKPPRQQAAVRRLSTWLIAHSLVIARSWMALLQMGRSKSPNIIPRHLSHTGTRGWSK